MKAEPITPQMNEIVDTVLLLSQATDLLFESIHKDNTQEIFTLPFIQKKIGRHTSEALELSKQIKELAEAISRLADQGEQKIRFKKYRDSLN